MGGSSRLYPGIHVHPASRCQHLTASHKFSLFTLLVRPLPIISMEISPRVCLSSQMHSLETSRAPATHSGAPFLPMSEPCSLCLPLHSSCDRTTCPSLLLFRHNPSKKADLPLDDEYWIVSTWVLELEESASRGCVVCATLYTGLMTNGRCYHSRHFAQLKVGRNGHVCVITDTSVGHTTELSFYTTRDAGKSGYVLFPTDSKQLE